MPRRERLRILAGTADGLHVLGGRSAPHLAGHEVRGLAADARGWWAIVDRRHLYHRASGARWKRLATLEGPDALCLQPAGDDVFVGTAEAGLHVWRDGAIEAVSGFGRAPSRDRWSTPWGGPPDTRAMALGPDGTLYVNVHVGGILRSRDAGETWKDTIDMKADVHQVATSPEKPRTLFAATAEGLAVSADAGATWTFETDGLHATYARAVALSRDRLLLSASHGPRGRQSGVFWRPLKGRRPLVRCEAGLPRWFDDNVNTFCLVARGVHAAIGTSDGAVFASADQGQSWQQIGDGLPAVRCLQIVMR